MSLIIYFCRLHIEGFYMPLVRIAVTSAAPKARARAVGQIVHRAMVEEMKVPEDDMFQILSHGSGTEVVYPASYMGITYSADLVLVQITLNQGRTVEVKKAFYNRLADDIHVQLKLRREDVFISLVEVVKENWSFGNGIMQYA
jgi:4-oxalocrotonate tautomerase